MYHIPQFHRSPKGRDCRILGQSRGTIVGEFSDWLEKGTGFIARGCWTITSRHASLFGERRGGVHARGRSALSRTLWCGMLLSLSQPGHLCRVRTLIAEQQHFVLAQKIHMGRNKERLLGLRSGKRSVSHSRGLLLWLRFSLTQDHESDRGEILFPQAKFTCGTCCCAISEAQSKQSFKKEK